MIFNLLLLSLITTLNVLTSWIPAATVLPFNADQYLIAGGGMIKFVNDVFPPMGILYEGLIWVIGWKLFLLFLRIIPVIRHLVSAHAHHAS